MSLACDVAQIADAKNAGEVVLVRYPTRTIGAGHRLDENYPMRKSVSVVLAIVALNALAAGAWAADRSQRRAKEVTANNGSIKVRATGTLNTVVSLYDGNDIANASFDYELVENHREALLQLGFSSVHIETAKGETLDKPL